jgi:peptide/nickel transport system substrate-binding protein
LTIVTGLLLACVPTATTPAVPPNQPAPPAPAANPPAQPAVAPAATSASAPVAAAKPAVTPSEPSGSITLVVAEEPPTLQSSEATGTYVYPVIRNIEESLTNRDSKTNELVGDLATKWERINPTTWRFALRQGVKFHDGSPFNAQAAADALKFVWSKENNF